MSFERETQFEISRSRLRFPHLSLSYCIGNGAPEQMFAESASLDSFKLHDLVGVHIPEPFIEFVCNMR